MAEKRPEECTRNALNSTKRELGEVAQNTLLALTSRRTLVALTFAERTLEQCLPKAGKYGKSIKQK